MPDTSPSPYGGLRRVLAVTGVAALVVAGGSAAFALADTTAPVPPSSGSASSNLARGDMSGAGAVAVTAGDDLAAFDVDGSRDPGAPAHVRVDSLVIGSVSALSGTTITVRTDDGRSVALPLSERLRQLLARPAVKQRLAAHPADGRRVVVGVAKVDGTDTAVRIRVVRPHVLGTVVAVTDTTWTVTDAQGFTRTVDVSGVDPTPKAAKGDVVLVVGTAAGADTLHATRVVVNPHGRALRAGRGLGRGPAGHRQGPGAPSTTQDSAHQPAAPARTA